MVGTSVSQSASSAQAPEKQKLRDRLSEFLESRYAIPLAALIGFLENTIILFAMEPLFLPAMASRGRGAWKIAAALLFGNVVAGVSVYFLALWAAGPLIEPLFALFDATESFHEMATELQNNCFVPLFMVGVTPIPFQLGAAAAGAAACNFLVFMVAITTSRAIRYFAEAFIIMAMGKRGEKFIQKHQLEIFILGIAIFIGMIAYYFLF